jgi:hypothetical protein
MRTFVIVALCASIALVINACEDSTAPTEQGTLLVRTAIPTMVISQAMPDGSVQEPGEVDSIRITRVRALFSRIKLHGSTEDTSDIAGRVVKAGPVVLTWSNDTVTAAFAAPLPAGLYDRMKLELHKFTASEAATWRNDTTFADFATASDRVTLIIDGVTWKDSVMTPFTLASDRTENLWVVLEPYFEITASSTTTVVLDFDAVELFRIGGRVINPNNTQVKTLLQTRLRTLLRLRKHT